VIRDRERYEKRVGTVVDGRWRIDSLLGRGSTAAVYAATHRNGHRATLKILHPALCGEPATIERFLREAGIANAIKHRAIVPIGDDGTTEDGCAYLVLELLDGETLEEIKERDGGRIPLEELAPMADELMSAITAVHAAGIVHRDLKPGNVFITTDKQLKLLDFGTARIFDRAGNSKLSVQGLVLGTPSFMAPEQARGIREEVVLHAALR
jgi:eukaryotic-like serine/threonine-protein kinase